MTIKYLAGAIMLICLALMADGVLADDSPTITLGGSAEFELGGANQKYFTSVPPFNRDFKFRNDNKFLIRIDGETDTGLRYGAVLQFEANINPDDSDYGQNADKTYGFLEGRFGRLEFGANTDAAQNMKVDASTFARAAGGIDGDWELWVGGLSVDINNEAPFIIRPDLPTAHAETTKVPNADKITYYSPRIGGFQAGLSFTPDQGDIGTASGWDQNSTSLGYYTNVINGGVNYNAKIAGISLAASVSGESGRNALHQVYEDLNAYNAGVNIGFEQFTFGGSYGIWNKSTLLRPSQFSSSPNYKDSYYWDIGAAYETGSYAASIGYLMSDYAGTHNLRNLSIGLDYKLAPGFTPFAEISFFKLQAGPEFDESGQVMLAGTKLNF